MTSVCKWLGFYLCMKEPAVVDKHALAGIHGAQYKCDMLITLRESKESSGGLAFDLILKPALLDNPPPVLMRTHSPNKELSQEDINKKLKEAEDRRMAMESQKLLSLQRGKERAAEANQRVQDLNDSFMRDSEKRLLEKMEVSIEKKTSQIKQLQERLKDHALRVEMIKRMGEESRAELKERIDKKLETAGEKRELQLCKVQERIRQHQKHIEEVIECSSKFSKHTEEKIIQKMESSLKNREDHLNSLLERLKKHDQHAQEIRLNKMNASMNEDSIGLLEDYDSEDDDKSTEEFQNSLESFCNSTETIENDFKSAVEFKNPKLQASKAEPESFEEVSTKQENANNDVDYDDDDDEDDDEEDDYDEKVDSEKDEKEIFTRATRESDKMIEDSRGNGDRINAHGYDSGKHADLFDQFSTAIESLN